MAKQLNNVQRAQQYLKKIFRLLNEQIFDNELEDVQVVLSNNSRVYGYYTLNGATWTGQANGEQFAQHEVGISSQFLASREIFEIVGTLCHECCHHLAYLKGIRDVSRHGYWHNKRFKEIAEQHGLIVEQHPKVGYGVTSCGERLLQFCIQYIFCSCIKSIDGHLQIQYIINRDLKSHFQKQTVFYTACFFLFQPEKDAFMRLFCLGFAHIVDGNSWQNATLTKEKLRATITTSQCRDDERRF